MAGKLGQARGDVAQVGLVSQGVELVSGRTLQGRAAFAAVAGDEDPAVGKTIDGQKAGVFAFPAAGVPGTDTEGGQSPAVDEGGRPAFIPGLLGQPSHAEGPHEPGDVRPHHLPAYGQFKSPEDRVIEEGPALNHHPIA